MSNDFDSEQRELRDSYVELHRSTGESYDSIAERIESTTGDKSTAAKIRGLAAEYPDDDPKPARERAPRGRSARGRQTAAGDGGVTTTAAEPVQSATGDGGVTTTAAQPVQSATGAEVTPVPNETAPTPELGTDTETASTGVLLSGATEPEATSSGLPEMGSGLPESTSDKGAAKGKGK